MNNMIGKITGIDWSKVNNDATHVNSKYRNFYKRGEKGWRCFYDSYSSETFISNDFPDKNSLNGVGGRILVSKEEDLQTKPKYTCLQDLPVGTFVKNNQKEDNISVWNGKVLCQMNPSKGITNSWYEDSIRNYVGFDYKYNPEYNIIAYSDRYDGEYISLIEQSKEVKSELKVPQAIKDCWKIKHIKHPDYKCGRDVAITILYRKLTGICYEYKYAICNVSDMFCRNSGVEIANNRRSRFIISLSNDKLFKNILQDIDSYLGGSVEFKRLKAYYCLNH